MSESTEVMPAPVASPKQETPRPESPPAKRRQASTSPQPSKRRRVSSDSARSPSATQESPKPIDKRDAPKPDRKNSLQEERKRGQRLFGGLLSTLSQSSAGTQQKRRQDIEKKQQEKAQRQKLEDEGRRHEKLKILKALRTQDMVGFEEESMRIRHSNMLAMAHFLQTKAEPKLYYKPWELLPEDADRIKLQIEEAESTIAREREEYEARNPSRKAAPPNPETQPEEPQEPDVLDDEHLQGEKDAEPSSIPDSHVADSTTTNNPAHPSSSSKENSNEGEVVLEAAEDTVIY